MKYFWQGFEKTGQTPIEFKKHTVLIFCDSKGRGGDYMRNYFKRIALKYPSVKIKIIDINKGSEKKEKHNINILPTVLLLKNGREADRVEGLSGSTTILEQLFKKAHV